MTRYLPDSGAAPESLEGRCRDAAPDVQQKVRSAIDRSYEVIAQHSAPDRCRGREAAGRCQYSAQAAAEAQRLRDLEEKETVPQPSPLPSAPESWKRRGKLSLRNSRPMRWLCAKSAG